MLRTPIYVNLEHKAIIEDYLLLVVGSITEVTGSNKEKYNDFIDVSNIIIEHHNNYQKCTNTGNWLDFLSIIPTNFSIMISGFLAGYENKRNRIKCRQFRVLLSDYAFSVVERLQKIKPTLE